MRARPFITAATAAVLLAGLAPTSQAAQPAQTITPAALTTSTITGFITTTAAVRVGGELQDTVTVTPGAARQVRVQYRKAGTTTWTNQRTITASSTGVAYARLTPPAAGTWYFRLLAPATSTASQAVTASRRVDAAGTAYATTVSGFSTAKTTIINGGDLEDPITISPRGTRVIEMQRRPYGSSGAYTTVFRGRYGSTSTVAVYNPDTAGTWQYRAVVLPDKTHRGWTSPPRVIVVPAPTTPRIYGWSTTPTSIAFGALTETTISMSISENETIGVVMEGRQNNGGTWGPWTILGHDRTVFRQAGIVAPIPGIGTWQLRLRSYPTPARNAAITPARTVTVAAPSCAPVTTYDINGTNYNECTVRTRTSPTIYAGEYVFHYTGNPDLSTHTGKPLIAYFHGDEEVVNWTSAPDNLDFTSPAENWALANGYVWVNPVSPLVIPGGGPAWGQAQGLWHIQVGIDTGIDIAALSQWLSSSSNAYTGYAGGSWFLGEALIPAGLKYAPGPVAMNCGAGSPWPPETAKYPPYGPIWTWWPTGDTALRARIPLFYNYSSTDPLAEISGLSKKNYASWGFTTSSSIKPAGTTCFSISFDPAVIDFLSPRIS